MYSMDLIDSILSSQGNSPKASKRFEQMPVIKRFALDPQARGQITSYYDLKDSVDETVRTIDMLEKTSNYKELAPYMKDNIGFLATREYIREMDKQMKMLQLNANMVRNSSMSPDAKRNMLKVIGEAENAMTSNTQYLKKVIAHQQ